ncbi:MAG: hypothetical protein HYY06_18550 [Deltaproteobacteria bacterium]|nr:hypothetical protein [Deltaproteobacteria bacterium]
MPGVKMGDPGVCEALVVVDTVVALDLRRHFGAFYDPPEGFAALPMDVEWKLVEDGGGRHVEVKQARPWPGRGEERQ